MAHSVDDPIDLTGLKFGSLIVIVESERRLRNGLRRHWRCVCVCGAEVDVLSIELRSGLKRSCGCGRQSWVRKGSRGNLAGQVFGKLTAVRDVGKSMRQRVWECRCECGRRHSVMATQLMQGRVKSCGQCGQRGAIFSTKRGINQ